LLVLVRYCAAAAPEVRRGAYVALKFGKGAALIAAAILISAGAAIFSFVIPGLWAVGAATGLLALAVLLLIYTMS
jgi:hypothetical protein